MQGFTRYSCLVLLVAACAATSGRVDAQVSSNGSSNGSSGGGGGGVLGNAISMNNPDAVDTFEGTPKLVTLATDSTKESSSEFSGSTSLVATASSSSGSVGMHSSFSGSSSSNGSDAGYACTCSDDRKVSLMGASDYCLPPAAKYSDKCGNQRLAEQGNCPIAGAQPCSDLGHVLTQDAVCVLNEADEVYKCVASVDDQDIQSGKKSKKKKKGTDSSGTSGSNLDAGNSATRPQTAFSPAHIVTVLATAFVGFVALV